VKFFRLIWAGLWRKPARTILTLLSIVVAFMLFGTLQGVNQGLNQAVQKMDVDRLYVTPLHSQADPLPISYFEQLADIPGVSAVSFLTYFGGFYRESRNNVSAFATNVPALFKVYNGLKINPQVLSDMSKVRTGALLSDNLAAKYRWKAGDRVSLGTSIWTQKSGSNTWEFDVVGTFDASAYGASFPGFLLNQAYFSEAAAFGNHDTSMFLVRVADPMRAQGIASAIDAKYLNSNAATRTEHESALMQRQLKQIADTNYIANTIAGAVIFTLLFLTANTMMQSVRERTTEFAVLKTLGFTDEKVLVLVLIESLLLCIFGAGTGMLIANAIFNSPGLQAILGAISMPASVLVTSAFLAVGLALISGLPPALRAKRVTIVEALAAR
jgi:putative ABC transport system permease protein